MRSPSWSSAEAIAAVPTQAIRARSHPTAVLGIWAWESALALLGSWPAIALVRGAYGRHPNTDAALWEGGGLSLLGFLVREGNGVRAAVGAGVIALLVGAVAGLLPTGALATSMAYETREGDRIGAIRSLDGALYVLRPFVALLFVVFFAQGLCAAGAYGLGRIVAASANGWLHEARAQELGLAFGVVAALPAIGFGVVQDLARAAIVRFDLGAMRGLSAGVRALRAAPFTLIWAWGWRSAVALVPIAGAAAIADRIGGRAGATLVILAALHQAVILWRVAFHASWLAKALRSVAAPARLVADDID